MILPHNLVDNVIIKLKIWEIKENNIRIITEIGPFIKTIKKTRTELEVK